LPPVKQNFLLQINAPGWKDVASPKPVCGAGGRRMHRFEAVKDSKTGNFALCNRLGIQVGARHGVPLRGFCHSFFVMYAASWQLD
jgi:hypothetical protein